MILTKEQIDGLGIQIESEGSMKFLIFLTADGNIKRSGSGKMSDVKSDLYIGQINEPLFDQAKKSVKENVLEIIGRQIDMPNPEGMSCKLTLLFKVGESLQQTVVNYGQKSGLPLELLEIVRTLHELTEPWYQKMKMAANPPEKKKGFWPFKR